MCIFSGPVSRVAKTNIFARAQGSRQTIVYSMQYAAAGKLAMILPIPVVPDSAEDAVKFINLEDCVNFFAEIEAGFPQKKEGNFEYLVIGDAPTAVRTLEVQAVGSFEASFVPRPEDFGRLDERFRLPAEIWTQLNVYRDWGFAVFKLRETQLADVHPMAFDFPRRDTSRLFFPTMHIHNTHVEPKAKFDHSLYCQPEPHLNWHLSGWKDTLLSASHFMTCPQSAQLLDLEQPCWRAQLWGLRENRDIWIGRGETLPQYE